MRTACLLLAFACAPVFAQESDPVILLPSAQGLQNLKVPPALRRFTATKLAGGTCSIPLLNVTPPGTPVKMPNVKPPNQVDRLMPSSVPAPACPSNMAHVGAPAPALPPPETPPPGTPAPRKP